MVACNSLLWLRLTFFTLITLVSLGCSAKPPPCDNPIGSIEQLYGTYSVTDVVQYGGSLDTETAVKTQLGGTFTLEEQRFSARGLILDKPIYQLRCYAVSEEGEVSRQRFSNFYGFAMERSTINTLKVYDGSVNEQNLVDEFEWVDGELWRLSDGWLYKIAAINSSATAMWVSTRANMMAFDFDALKLQAAFPFKVYGVTDSTPVKTYTAADFEKMMQKVLSQTVVAYENDSVIEESLYNTIKKDTNTSVTTSSSRFELHQLIFEKVDGQWHITGAYME